MPGPTYTYTANVPLGSQRISSTQAPINNNFQAINELLAVNHVGFNTPDDFGKHKWVTFPLQASNPATPTVGGEFQMFAKNSTLTSQSELFLGRQNGGVPYEFTASLNASSGWTRLPSGLLLKWGVTGNLNAGANTITFPTGVTIPAFTSTPFNIQVSARGNGVADQNTAFYVYTLNTTTFGSWLSVRDTAAGGTVVPTGIYWFAIGV